MRPDRLDNRAFDGAHIGHNRALFKVRRNLFGNRRIGSDRSAENNQIRALYRLNRAFIGRIDNAKLLGDATAVSRARRTDDFLRQALFARRACDGRADQTDADQRQPFEFNFRHNLVYVPRKSLSASVTAWFSSSSPMLIRRQVARP